MTFRGGARLDPSQVEDHRGRGGMGGGMGGPVVVGGGGIGIVILIIAMLLGVNPLSEFAGTTPGIDGAPSAQECQTGADANKRDDCRIVGFVNSIQKYWGDEFARRGETYLPAKTVLFSGYTQGACGLAQSAMGPFYCPEDQKVYLDTTFFEELQQRFGAQGGPFAVGYVVAHEYGHHLQNILGLLEQSQSGNQASIRVELMADCLAGVWARHAADTGYLEAPTEAEIAQALDAAAAVGDDRIQQQTQGRVQPESWTHGSSAQRQQWFRTGYQTGDMNRCDTSRV
jgi:predicted metalloprotease